MFQEYLERYSDDADSNISQSGFYKIAQSLTAFDQTSRKAVDYAAGVLLYDNITYIKSITETLDLSESKKETVRKMIVLMETFMKHRFAENHIVAGTSTHCSHHFKYALEPETTPMLPFGNCDECQLPFKIMHYLKKQVPEDALEKRNILDDCKEKIFLYMAHLVRVHNQRKRLNAIYKNLADDECVMAMDYKMKFEELRFREKTNEHYGKKGLSWHGTLIYSKTPLATQESAAEVVAESDRALASYSDDISSGDTKQDADAVISIFEVNVKKIKKGSLEKFHA